MQIATVVKSWVIALPARFIKSIRADLVFRRLLVNSGWLLGSNTVTAGIAFVQGILITRLLGVEQYGVLGIVMTFVSMAKRLTSFRMNEFIVKYTSDFLVQDRRDIAAATLKLGYLLEGAGSFLSFGVACLIAPYAAKWFIGNTSAVGYIYGYAAILLIGFIGETSRGVLQTFKQFRQLSLLTILAQAVTFIGVVIAFANHTGIGGVLIAYFIGRAVSSVTLMVSAWQLACAHIGKWWKTSLGCLSGQRRTMFKFALHTNIGATLSLVIKDSDALWLGFFRNPIEVGYYKLATSLASLILMPVSPLSQTIYPEITEVFAKNQFKKSLGLFRRGSLIALTWVFPTIVGFVFMGAFFITCLYGADFLPAHPAAVILLVGQGFAATIFWTRPALLSLGRPDYVVRIALLALVLKVAMVLLLVPRLGYIAIAAILSGLNLINGCIFAMFIMKQIRQKE